MWIGCIEQLYVNEFILCTGNTARVEVLPDKTGIIRLNMKYFVEGDYYKDLGNENVDSVRYTFKSKSDYGAYDDVEIIDSTIVINEDITPINTDGEEVYNKNGIQIWFKGVNTHDSGRHDVLFLVKNSNEDKISLYPDDEAVSINGTIMETYAFNSDIPGDTYGYIMVELEAEVAKEHKIDKITDVSLVIEVEDSDYEHFDTIELNVEVK
jgi:hypothetical protein